MTGLQASGETGLGNQVLQILAGEHFVFKLTSSFSGNMQ